MWHVGAAAVKKMTYKALKHASGAAATRRSSYYWSDAWSASGTRPIQQEAEHVFYKRKEFKVDVAVGLLHEKGTRQLAGNEC